MTVEGEFIAGAMLGIEFFDDDLFGKGFVLDLLIYRMVVTYD